jgi:hypothetical protein
MSSERPDSRIFASYPMPAKIDLINERPRRESQIERQLEDKIGQISASTPMENSVPKITVTEQYNTIVTTNTHNGFEQHHLQQPGWQETRNMEHLEGHSPTNRREIKETRIIINQHSAPIVMNENFVERKEIKSETDENRQFDRQSTVYSQQQQQQQQQTVNTHQTATTTNQSSSQQLPSLNMALNKTISNNKAILEAELAEKEAKLMKEISALHQRPYSPYQTPAKIDLTSEQWISQQQHRNAPQMSSRPNSRASNKSNPAQDLLEKEAKLLKEIEEIESKPFNPQTMIVEREQWYEYPENRPHDRHLTESKRRVRDFCSMPPGLCQDRHIHEENLPPRPGQVSITPESIHTTIIRSPKREIDNKSPLPFAFDNFTTKGVRGNIASVGAVEPERPPPPIFPIVKRSPSPNVARG